MMAYLLTAAALVNYLLFAWFLGTLLKLKSPDVWILRGGLAIIGLGGAALFLWYWIKRDREKKLLAPAGPGGGGDELDALLNEAEAKLAASRLQQGASFGSLPVILLVGPAGSTKTSSMVNSGLEPELLAGQIFQDTTIVPTRSANLWFAGKAVFAEASGRLTGDAAAWSRLIRRMQPRRLGSIFGRGSEAPRAAVVCLPCDIFLKPGAADNVASAARTFAGRLSEVSQLLGINLPVYVLFTKLDRLSFFHDYVQNLNEQEHSQVLGVTLPGAPQQRTGVYAEQESARLTGAFNQLFYSLADKRTALLSRENGSERLPGIYEFPREFRKLRSVITQFLVDLCRPSQLSSGPFLRGFYFCGVRPVIVKDVVVAAAPRASLSQPHQPKGDATGIFQMEQLESGQRAPQPAAPAATTRKVPQWVFLNHFFASVLLTDRAGMGASGSSVKTNTLRRILYASAAGLCLLLCPAFIISFFGNRGLESEARAAASGISAADANGAGLSEALNRLETLRQSLETLTLYEREGPPLHLRWGLYAGNQIYPAIRRLYFDRFHRLLFRFTQAGLVTTLKGLPNAPGPTDDCGYPYDTLKAYMMTTSHHDKTTQAFLSPLLKNRWAAGRPADPTQMNLAQKQFDFYSDELLVENPFSSSNDAAAVEKGQTYVSLCAGSDRVYQIMLAEANKSNPAINFNRTFAGSAEVVINNRDVAGAYSKAGWGFMQNAIKNAQSFAARDEWVLGKHAGAKADSAKLEQDLRTRYYADFINQWRDYLKKSTVVRYADFKDAAKKLSKTASSQSPLLAMFWLASQNTGVDPDVAKAFKPLHAVVPPTLDQPSGPPNKDYISALGQLQLALENAAGQPGGQNDQAVEQIKSSANAAKLLAGQMPLGLDQEAHLEATVLKLLEDPITSALGTIRPPGPPGKALCAEFKGLFSKYPFTPGSPIKATIDDITGFFAPEKGSLWVFYDKELKKSLTPQGTPIPGATPAPTPAFARFFAKAAAFSKALYTGGSATPKLALSMKPVMAADVQSLRLEIEGQPIDFSSSSSGAKQFFWPGAASHGVRLSAKWTDGSGDYPTYDGLWGIVDFFSEADTQPTGSGTTFGWMLRGGRQGRPVTNPAGVPRQVRFDLDMGGGPQVFQKGYFPSMACTER